MKKSNNKELLAQHITQLEKRFNKVKKVMTSPTLARAFLLILAGNDWTGKLASIFRPEINKKITNDPKIISIHIRDLREARIIKRAKKDGRIQHYEPDWEGIADVFLFTDVGDVNDFGIMLQDTQDLNDFYTFVIEKILKKYFDYLVKAFQGNSNVGPPIKIVRSLSGRGSKVVVSNPNNFYPFEYTLEELLKRLSNKLSVLPVFFSKIEEKLKEKSFDASKNAQLNLFMRYIVEQHRDMRIDLHSVPEGRVISDIYNEFMMG